jgi:two-component system, LytTR family, sensor kinase
MLVSAAWVVPAVLATVNVVAQRRLSGEPPAGMPELLFAGGDWLLYAFLTPGVFAISKRWPLARPHLARHAIVHLAMSLAFCAAWAGAGTVLRVALTPRALYYPPPLYFVSWLFITFPFGVAVYLCVVGIEHAIRYFDEARRRELQMARLAEQLSGARFAALQAQINPHFLFNTLNTIAVLVRDDDRAGAVRIVEQLGDVLRRTLSRHRTNEVTLGEELELVRHYLAIEQARFSDRLRPTFDVGAAVLTAAVPGFAVQHLVENAIRHGVAKRSDAGSIAVLARRDGDMLEVSVVDDGAGIDDRVPPPKGHGIENTRERLRALYGDRAALTIARGRAGGAVATLRVPYHERPTDSDDAAR